MNRQKQTIDPNVAKLIAFIKNSHVDTEQMAAWERQFLAGYIYPSKADATVSRESYKGKRTSVKEPQTT
ncbi:MAG: hypothetical protein EHM48_08490 [Planctomycetaceae bacterium]|nr:MAG: hypothetical protein EHM48_08490 [Planctomycetaceae bacterium]